MKKIYNIILMMLAAVVLLPSCSKEELFPGDDSGKPHSNVNFSKIKKDSEVNTIEQVVRAASTEEVDLNTFMVEVTLGDKTYYSGTLAEMPEIMSLPVGEGFVVNVHSPEDPAAAWDTPYYAGSQTFKVVEGEVTYVEPVVCKLANVKVSVVFDSKLLAVMGSDCQVKVETGSGASLVYTKDETRAGFFRYEAIDGQSTIVATFTGTVDENYEENFRTYTSVAPGNHYIITYTLHGVEGDDVDRDGKVTPGVYVDSTVSDENLTVNVDDDDKVLDDKDRPTEGEGDDPNPPTPPVGDAPTLTVTGDISGEDAWRPEGHVVPSGSKMNIMVDVHSSADGGITAFTVDIDSDTLTDDVLQDVGLQKHLDLVNPGDLIDGLQVLGFPVNVGGMTDPPTMNITEFTSLLGAFGSATHKFTITVSDANGTTRKTLTLISK